MITLHTATATDFSTLGLGALTPTECTVREESGGAYELQLRQPVDNTLRHAELKQFRIIKAPVPARETPLLSETDQTTETVQVEREIYRVSVRSRLRLRAKPSTSSAIINSYKNGTRVIVLEKTNDSWYKVSIENGGASGYMSTQYLRYVETKTDTITTTVDTPGKVVNVMQSREQLFRIESVESDTRENVVIVNAKHISYDVSGAIVNATYEPENVAASEVCKQLVAKLDHDISPFEIYCNIDTKISGDYSGKNLLECLLDSENGVAAKCKARVFRDNYTIYILPDETRDLGMQIRYGKNLLSASMTTDTSDIITRIKPVGKNKDGEDLYINENNGFVDSDHINEYPVIYAKKIEYDVVVGDDLSQSAAIAKLKELAQEDFKSGIDMPKVSLNSDFVRLELTEKYKALANAYSLHIYDSARVVADDYSINVLVRMVKYTFDCIQQRYTKTELGDITETSAAVYGYEIARGSLDGNRLVSNTVNGDKLRNLSIEYAKISNATVERLAADAIVAIRADIHEIVAGQITTDELYVDLAKIALAEISNAEIDIAQIKDLTAEIAKITTAQIAEATITVAQIQDLNAAVATIADARIAEAKIDGAQITDGTITNAKIENGAIDTAKIALGAITTALIATGAVGTAQIADGSITDAKIVSLNADVINAGTLSVDRLLLKGPDGLFVAINATDEGLTSEQLSQEEYQSAISGSVLVARSVTADKIAAKSITANEIAAGAITTAELAAESVDASKIKAGSIMTSHVAANFGETLDISSNEQVEIIAGNVQQAQETADSAQEAAEQAAPYISATPPETAPEAGKLWLDEGVTPSVLRKWRGVEATTEREYEETVESDAPPITLDNTQGQLQTVAVRAECRAKQAGSGDPSPDNVRAITGRASVEVRACGKNLFDINDRKGAQGQASVESDENGWISISANNTNGGSTIYGNYYTEVSSALRPNTNYIIAYELVQADVSGPVGLAVIGNNPDSPSQFTQDWSIVIDSSRMGTHLALRTTTSDFTDVNYMLRTFVHFNPGSSGTVKFRLSVLQYDPSITAETFVYEPYRSMGGGTVVPTEPLYGLPGAEDRVEVSVDGDVLVTRRTAALELDGTENWILGIKNDDGYYWRLSIADIYQITTPVLPNIICSHYQTETPDAQWGGTDSCISQNYNANARTEVLIYDTNYAESDLSAWKAYLAAQASSGTPVQIVYELETPQSEALSAVLPITPAKGQVNLSTDADSLTATITGSGWETVNDTSGLAGDISSTQSGLEDLSDKLDAANDAIAQMASQIITPDGIVATVEASAGYQSIKTQAETAATGVSVINTKVIEVDGRLEKIEGSVRIQGSEITLGRSDSPYQNTINEEGSVITEDGQEILAIRGSKMESARVQISDAIIIGGIAIKTTSDGHVYFLRR